MKEYHKIQTVWKRDQANNYRTLLEGFWATQEIAYLKDLTWVFTEKVDGTNVRVMWDGSRYVSVGARPGRKCRRSCWQSSKTCSPTRSL